MSKRRFAGDEFLGLFQDFKLSTLMREIRALGALNFLENDRNRAG